MPRGYKKFENQRSNWFFRVAAPFALKYFSTFKNLKTEGDGIIVALSNVPDGLNMDIEYPHAPLTDQQKRWAGLNPVRQHDTLFSLTSDEVVKYHTSKFKKNTSKHFFFNGNVE
jgi:hypothetical protein